MILNNIDIKWVGEWVCEMIGWFIWRQLEIKIKAEHFETFEVKRRFLSFPPSQKVEINLDISEIMYYVCVAFYLYRSS